MSTTIGIRFLAGRYHATPWYRHVNEAEVEWPPSPVRLLRALIATWHRKVDPEAHPDEVLTALIHKLSGDRPRYRLPDATLAHSRHYMPVRSGSRETTRLVFDSFLRIRTEDELLVSWPHTVLANEERALLSHLLDRMGYLGRAEAWVECRLLDEWTEAPTSMPASEASADAHASWEFVDVVAPMNETRYVAWRDERISDLGLERPRRRAEKRLRATLPERLVDALRMDTSDSRHAGWSRAPGMETVTYVRPESCFAVDRSPRTPTRSMDRSLTTVRLALLGKPLPRIEDAVKIGEIVRAAAMHHADRLPGSDGVPAVLSGHDLSEDACHDHAFYLPEDADRDGHIEHVLIHADMGLGRDTLRALHRIPKIWEHGGTEWRVVLESYGSVDEFQDHPYLSEATEWTSVTPYLHPWFRKKSFTLEDQLRRECRERGLPEPNLQRLRSIRVNGRERRSVHFHRFRNRRGLTQPDTRGSFWQLRFPEPVRGPVALGFGCHYGLGMFAGVGGV